MTTNLLVYGIPAVLNWEGIPPQEGICAFFTLCFMTQI